MLPLPQSLTRASRRRPLFRRGRATGFGRARLFGTGAGAPLEDLGATVSRRFGGCGAVAQQRKGYYRARHYVKPSSASSRWKKPSTGVILVAVLLAIAGWNTLVGNDSSDTEKSPQPRPSEASAPADPGQ